MRLVAILLVLTACGDRTETFPGETPGGDDGARELVEVQGFGSNPGALSMYTYTPAQLPEAAPLIVVLHGCTQAAADLDEEQGWMELADEDGLALLLPEQRGTNNSARCFNWFSPTDTARTGGEAESIAQMTQALITSAGLDAGRVYIAGFSAGAAMAAAVLAVYPELYAGAALFAGVPYGCASSFSAALDCMAGTQDETPSTLGDRLRAAAGSYSGPWPTVSIWHGTSDATVDPSNARELVEQLTNLHGADATADAVQTLAGHSTEVFTDGQGLPVVERHELAGMGHAFPIDVGQECGAVAAYTSDQGVCGARMAASFFGVH